LREVVEGTAQGLSLDDKSGDHTLDVENRFVEAVDLEQDGAKTKTVERIELDRLAPARTHRVEEGSARDAEQVLELVADEIAMEDGVDCVLELGSSIDERAAITEEVTQGVGVGIRKPDRGEVVDAGQLGEDSGVDLVGLDLGLSDLLCRDGVGEDEASRRALKQPSDGNGVGADLESEGVGGEQIVGQGQEVLARRRESTSKDQLARLVEHGELNLLLVKVEADETRRGVGRVTSGQERHSGPPKQR
jgi:hypothetical protein